MTALYDVALVDFPVAMFQQMQQQHDAMLREFSLIVLDSDSEEHAVPRRLVALAQEMHAQFGLVRVFRDGVAAAVERGDVVTSLRLKIPVETLEWCEAFLVLFAEADEFCRQGQLLTPPSPPEVVEFREWLVGELMRQIRDGASATPFWAQGS